ncbi:MAG: hypothetical protein ABI690_05770 [Chloroflexota bacterium]
MSTPNSVPPSFKVPFNIPDAPERVTMPELVNDTKPLLQTTMDSFQRKPGAFETALSQATWWHFWLLVGASGLVNAICSTITLVILDSQYSRFYSRGILSIIIYLILAIPVGMAIFYIGSYASHWWATKQAGGSATLVQHSYVLGVIWAGEVIISSVLSLVFSLIGLGGLGALISLAVALFALYLMGDSIGRLYQFQDRNQVWITAAVMVVVSWLATLVLFGVLGSVLR